MINIDKIIQIESSGRPDVVSSKGAIGFKKYNKGAKMKSLLTAILTVILISGCTTTQTTNQIISEEPVKAEDSVQIQSTILDAFPIEKLTINTAVDSPQLIRHYTNGWTTEHPWGLIKNLPVTVTIKKFDASGIELDGVKQGKYENERWERTSTFWAFDENGNELGYEDNAAPNYPEPKRFYGIAKYILVVSCSDYDGFNATGRSRVTEVK